jgi:heme A synthase
MFIAAIAVASVVWFVLAAVLFFNPVTDKAYRSEEGNPAVRRLPQSPKTIGMILISVVIQSALGAYVYSLVSPSFSGSKLTKGLVFGFILVLTKIIPRDIDRILLTTYPKKRMTIEFIIGIICSIAVGVVFGYLL